MICAVQGEEKDQLHGFPIRAYYYVDKILVSFSKLITHSLKNT
mgnify:CR=1 FL=1